jgi:DNA-directed RNA polymerase specialized sigma24 family protein
MLDTTGDVIHALVRYEDVFDPKSGSLLVARSGGDTFADEPFRGDLLTRIEERAELRRRLGALDARERELLCLWYVASWPVVRIARQIGVSRVHCYRLRNRALREMTRDPEDGSPQGGSA